MEFKIEERPEYAWLTVKVPARHKLFVEASAMASMSSNMNLRALFRGGFRRFLSGENLFLSEFTADGIDGEVCIAPGPSGDMAHITLNNETFYLASSCYVAHSQGVNYETKFQSLSQGLLSGAGWFLVKMQGSGDVWFNGYGQIVELEVHDQLVIDNGHIVAFSDGVEYDIIKLGGYKSLFFSGEGFVCRFRGRGKVYVQTKKPASLIAWAQAFRRIKRSNN
ncbi:MAG TPA: TIGR00266 family protein [Pseudobdellovibrionaceae bacterium]|nr:TIGR00266 family protein [Pseudobdellovibrionaceae bacterium]